MSACVYLTTMRLIVTPPQTFVLLVARYDQRVRLSSSRVAGRQAASQPDRLEEVNALQRLNDLGRLTIRRLSGGSRRRRRVEKEH